MKTAVKDVMVTQYSTLQASMSISQAVQCLKDAAEKEDRRIFGMLVTDENSRLVGMLSMYDILLYIQPKHIHIWGAMDDVDIAGLLENACDRLKPLRVDDLMTTEIVSVTPDTHLLVVLDIMIKKHIRRIPVLQEDKIEGIIYISDLFYHLAEYM